LFLACSYNIWYQDLDEWLVRNGFAQRRLAQKLTQPKHPDHFVPERTTSACRLAAPPQIRVLGHDIRIAQPPHQFFRAELKPDFHASFRIARRRDITESMAGVVAVHTQSRAKLDLGPVNAEMAAVIIAPIAVNSVGKCGGSYQID
jgi:hypothetical protein